MYISIKWNFILITQRVKIQQILSGYGMLWASHNEIVNNGKGNSCDMLRKVIIYDDILFCCCCCFLLLLFFVQVFEHKLEMQAPEPQSPLVEHLVGVMAHPTWGLPIDPAGQVHWAAWLMTSQTAQLPQILGTRQGSVEIHHFIN